MHVEIHGFREGRKWPDHLRDGQAKSSIEVDLRISADVNAA
jgi:hypothetical protein